jgi:hypothetical protein
MAIAAKFQRAAKYPEMRGLKSRSSEVIRNMAQWNPECPIHQRDPFGENARRVVKPFAPNRDIADWEWMDADDKVCECEWEKREVFPQVSIKGRKPGKVCSTCHMERPANGRCCD